MRYLDESHALRLHRRVIEQSGGSDGLRDRGALASAIAQPRMTFGGEELYPTLIEKVAAMGYSLIMNHPFVDGNKRIGHAMMEAMLEINGHHIEAPLDEAERIILDVAAGAGSREQLVAWLQKRVVVTET